MVSARVTVEAGGRRQVAERFGGGSYQSASDPRLHFGLGVATSSRRPGSAGPPAVDRFRALPADTVYLIREGDAAPRFSASGWEAPSPLRCRPCRTHDPARRVEPRLLLSARLGQ